MRLHINGEEAVLFFRYKRNYMDKRDHIRADISEKLTPQRMGSISETDKEEALLEQLPPNICECYIVKGWTRPEHGLEGKVGKIAFGHSWRHPKDNHNKEVARKRALASAISHWPRGAREIMWTFLHQRGQIKHMLETVDEETGERDFEWLPWTDLNISTLPSDYPEPASTNKGVSLKDRPV